MIIFILDSLWLSFAKAFKKTGGFKQVKIYSCWQQLSPANKSLQKKKFKEQQSNLRRKKDDVET